MPAWEAAIVAPESLAEDADLWAQLDPSPVMSIHVIYGSRVTQLPFAAAADSPVHWVMDKTAPAGLHAGQYLAASVRAADGYLDMPVAQLRAEFLPAMARLFPAAAEARSRRLLRDQGTPRHYRACPRLAAPATGARRTSRLRASRRVDRHWLAGHDGGRGPQRPGRSAEAHRGAARPRRGPSPRQRLGQIGPRQHKFGSTRPSAPAPVRSAQPVRRRRVRASRRPPTRSP